MMGQAVVQVVQGWSKQIQFAWTTSFLVFAGFLRGFRGVVQVVQANPHFLRKI